MKVNILTHSAEEKDNLVKLLMAKGFRLYSGKSWANHCATRVKTGRRGTGRVRGVNYETFPVVSVRVESRTLGFARNGEYRDQKALDQLTASQTAKVFGPAPAAATAPQPQLVRVGNNVIVNGLTIPVDDIRAVIR